MKKVIDGFDFSVDLEKYRFTNEDFARIEKALEVDPLTREQRLELQGLCDFFVSFAESWNLAPRPKKIRDRLEKVRKDSNQLIKTLLDLHDQDGPDRTARQATIEYLHKVAPENDWAENGDDLFRFMRQLGGVMEAARDSQIDLPEDKGGQSGDPPLNWLVKELAQFYFQATDNHPPQPSYDPYDEKTPYKGRFFSFVDAFLTPLPEYTTRGNQGLGTFIKRILVDFEPKVRTHDKT